VRSSTDSATVSVLSTRSRSVWVRLAGAAALLLCAISLAQPVSPPTLSFSAASTRLAVGKSTTLRWSSTNATSCTASGAWSASISGSKVKSGTAPTGNLISPRSEFVLTCTGPGGSVTSSVVVETVSFPVLTLGVSDSSLNPGESATVTWSAPLADSCTASGSWSGNKATAGQETFSALTKGAKTYTLSCKNSAGTDRKSVKVDVVRYSRVKQRVFVGVRVTLPVASPAATGADRLANPARSRLRR